MTNIKKISDFNFKSKKVLVRVDLNVPIKNGIVADATRIKAILPTLNQISRKGGICIIISHFGRPKGKKIGMYSLKKIVKPLSKYLGKKVFFCHYCYGNKVIQIINKLKPGEYLLLENLRFHKEETENNKNFAKKLSKFSDIYINDAFSVSHRMHASIDQITKFLPSGIGINMKNEINNLEKYLLRPKKPTMAIIGGAKMENKINVLKKLLTKCNFLVLGGGIANTFLKANKINIGNSLYEKKQINNAKIIINKAKKHSCEIILPIDVVLSNKNKMVGVEEIQKNEKIFDIGKKTLQIIFKKLNKSKTVLWSGPLGLFEKKPYDKSTNALAKLINSKGKKIISIAGGGDTIAAIKKNKQFKNFTFLSTGGGAFLKWLENFNLLGIESLKNNKLN